MRARSPRGLTVVLVAGLLAATVACSDDGGSDDDGAGKTADYVGAQSYEGTFDSGSDWQIQTPETWNGALLVFSHGYIDPEKDNVVQLAPEPTSQLRLLEDGYALAGSSFPTTGWSVQEGIDDQLQVLDEFRERVGTPERTIAWGSSMGALMTVGLLEEHPDRFDGGVAMCGVLAGSVAFWDQLLDISFGLRTLLVPDPDVQLSEVTRDQGPAQARLQEELFDETKTPIGAARVALVSALAGMPGSNGSQTEIDAQAADLVIAAALGGASRRELEERFGGNPSSNDGVDVRALLAASPRRADVEAAYRAAGADLEADLEELASAPRVTADPAAREELAAAYTPTGRLEDPLLTLHTTGDPFAVLANEGVYADRAEAAGTADLLRQTVTERYGHCFFLPSEVVPVVEALDARVKLGRWPALDPGTLNDAAFALAIDLKQTKAPTFVEPDLPTDPRLAAAP